MGVFYLYADESGKLKKSEITSFCGFVGQDLEWWRFTQEWESRRLKWGVPAIHMAYVTDPNRDKSGEWAKVRQAWGNTWEDRKKEMLLNFASLIRESNLVCVGNSVDAVHYEKMPETDYKREMRDPLYLSFYNLVRNAIDKLDCLHSAHTLSVVIDDDQQSSENYYNLLGSMRKQFPKEVNDRISQLAFANDVAYPGLQAADMIAYESRGLMILKRQHPATATPTVMYGLMTNFGLNEPTLYTPEFLDILNKDKGHV